MLFASVFLRLSSLTQSNLAAADLSVLLDFDLQSTFPNIDQHHTYPCSQMHFGMDWGFSVCFFQVRDAAAGIVANADTKFRHLDFYTKSDLCLAEAEAEAEADAETETKTENEAEAEAETKTEDEADAESEAKTENEADAESEPKTENVADAEAEAKTNTEAETDYACCMLPDIVVCSLLHVR